MSYLTLNKQEIKELLELRLAYLLGYLITMVILFKIYLEVLRYFIPRMIAAEPPLPILAFMTSSLLYLIFCNREYLSEIIQKRKKIYKGMLSLKTVSGKEYQFNMDGYVFTVDRSDFQKFSEGDFLEFHISPSTKHLFKVIKAE